MQGIVVITKPDQWAPLIQRPNPGAIRSYDVSPERHVVEFADDYVAYNRDDHLERDYEPGELDLIPSGARTFILVEYTSPKILRQIILDGALADDAWIDDDNNPPVTVREFRDRLSDPTWDWRT